MELKGKASKKLTLELTPVRIEGTGHQRASPVSGKNNAQAGYSRTMLVIPATWAMQTVEL
jgi:hypothetical protein